MSLYGASWLENLSKLIYDRNVLAECAKRDRYGREVCKVLDGSIDAGLEQIRAGMAWWYRAYAKEQVTRGSGGPTSPPSRKPGRRSSAYGASRTRCPLENGDVRAKTSEDDAKRLCPNFSILCR